MMIGKLQKINGFVMFFQFLNKWIWIGDTAESQNGIGIIVGNSSCFLVQRLQVVVFQIGEKHLLFFCRLQFVDDALFVFFAQVFRRFADNDDLCTLGR